ncbi:MAG: tetratricopeptide repeat protein [Planctomycetaceae bacterium]|nr:tetratricopeptide repeat protein [Planctomycetaceae bacterium]
MESANTPSRPGFVGRLTRVLFARPLVLAIALLVLGGIGGGIAFFSAGEKQVPPEELIAQSLAHIEREEFEPARKAAEKLAQSKDFPDKHRGMLAYLLGYTLVRLECEQERRPDRRAGLYMVAARYFEEASLQGVPPEYQPAVDYWNGRSLVLAQQASLARGPLESALVSNPQRRREILAWLGEAYLQDTKLPKDKGLQYLEQLLAEPDLTPAERYRCLGQKAQMLLLDDQLEAASQIWESLPNDAGSKLPVQLALGRYYLKQAEAEQRLRSDPQKIQQAYENAVRALTISDAKLLVDEERDRGSAMFLLGKAQKGAGQTAAAIESFAYVRRHHFDYPIGIAAGFHEAQCQLEGDDFAGAFRLFSSLLRETVRPNNQGETEWLNQDSITEMIEAAVSRYIQVGDCATAVQLADEFHAASSSRTPPIPLGNAARLRVNALEKWVKLLETQLAQVSFNEREEVKQALQDKYSEYAHSLYSLAVNRFASDQYTSNLFEAGEYFYRAQDFHRAVLALQQYLASNDLKFAAQARLRIGQSQMAQRQYQVAADSFANCWTLFPNDPVVYQARYQAAECYLELENPELAEEILRGNLDNDKLTPSSQEWIESLYLLGTLFFEQGKKFESRSNLAETEANLAIAEDHIALMEQAGNYYSQAINRLSEAVQRAPESPLAPEGLYCLAESYRRRNRWHEKQIESTTISSQRVRIGEIVRRDDERAIQLLGQLEEQLQELREREPLSQIQERLLRNSYFVRGQLYYRLGQFESSIQMYRTVSNKVIQEPEVLEAYVQIASCYRRLNRNDEATRVVNQAKIILRDRIPANADFEATTRFPRERWVLMLDWLASI